MDTLETVGYTSLGLLAGIGVAGMLLGFISSGPGMIVGLLMVLGVGALLIKVIKERLGNAEDDHYSKTVDK